MKHCILIIAGIIFLQWCLSGIGTAQDLEAELEQIKDLWHNQRYEACYQALKAFQGQYRFRNFETDYMRATSACRTNRWEEAVWFFDSMLSYVRNSHTWEQVANEKEQCSPSSPPPDVAREAVIVSGGGVYGKTFYWVDSPENAPLGNASIQFEKDIPVEELRARLFPPENSEDAAAHVNTLVGSRYRIRADEHFILAVSGQHSEDELSHMLGTLNRVMDFYLTYYDIPQPSSLITVYIVSSPYSLQRLALRLHGLRISESSLGYSFQEDLSILGVTPTVRVGTLVHELFHLLVQKNFHHIPPWLNEGMASLYEVSTFEDNRLLGIPNWRGPILERFWRRRPPIQQLIQMTWREFDQENVDAEPLEPQHPEDMKQQAVNHATARYFALYLQEQGKLKEVYLAFRDAEPEALFRQDGDGRVHLLEETLHKSIDKIEQDFSGWFLRLHDVLVSHDDHATIEQVQTHLAEKGFNPGSIDGVWGPTTRNAVEQFQRAQGFRVTGKLDWFTLQALEIEF